jgi:outer membrane immunogenic protein
LLYGKVGYSNLQVGTTTTVAGVSNESHRDLDGVVVGAGLEVAISPKAYVKTEYDYSNYSAGVTKNDILTGIGLRF